MPSPNQTGVKQVYTDHEFFDQVLQPIDMDTNDQIRTDFIENVMGHRSGINAPANQGANNIRPVYEPATTPLYQNFRDEQNRGNPNSF